MHDTTQTCNKVTLLLLCNYKQNLVRISTSLVSKKCQRKIRWRSVASSKCQLGYDQWLRFRASCLNYNSESLSTDALLVCNDVS